MFSRTIQPPGNVAALRRRIMTSREGVLLESVAADTAWARFSIYALEPTRVLSVSDACGLDPLSELARVCRPWIDTPSPEGIPFAGGWIGYLAYEAGRFVEPAAGFHRLPPTMPIAEWALFDVVLVHDAATNKWTIAGTETPETLGGSREALAGRLRRLESLVRESDGAADLADRPSPRLAYRDGIAPSDDEGWNYTRQAYFEKIERALDYIRAGDIFQVNVTRRCRLKTATPDWLIYERLREANPSAFAAYLPLRRSAASSAANGAILSSSPELLLQLQQGRVITRPIKGTRPRGRTADSDAAAQAELAASEKDRAELNMIIDLERNDLGRVCEFGSVRVEHGGEIETLPTVFHRTATISGTLREGVDAIDLLRATFPGGSITGAPKVRAMQIIHELEPTPRGPYCGAIGWIGLNGDMMLNLPIRTMIAHEGCIDLQVGSGIVADSDTAEEYAELAAKAAGMMRAISREAVCNAG